MTDQELIKKAKAVVSPRKMSHGSIVGDVGAALVSQKGNLYVGVCINAACGIGFCAEHAAIAAMLTRGEQRIKHNR